MEKGTFELLKLLDVQAIIQANILTEVKKFALRFKSPQYPVAPIATQIKYLQKCQQKLPSFYQHACIIPPLSYEQCSSEQAAKLKNVSAGKNCLDLTCGLGVDSLYFADLFESVISLEKDETLAQIAQYNFQKIGKNNLKVIAKSAEEYVQNYEGAPFDLIYLDPARRDEVGAKIFLPQDCSPNLVELLPKLLVIGKTVMAKLSPMYDVKEALRQFQPYLKEIAVISIENECKEVLLTFLQEKQEKVVQKIICHGKKLGTQTFDIEQDSLRENSPYKKGLAYSYLYEPDVAFYKCNALPQLFQGKEGYLTANNGFFLSDHLLEHFAGRIFKIDAIQPFKPDLLKKALKKEKVKQANLLQRNFPLNSQQIQQQLGIESGGGEEFLIFTTVFLPEKELISLKGKRVFLSN
ncbi:MAG: THUMP-like domain-containing protein [Bacteroidia bacterium]